MLISLVTCALSLFHIHTCTHIHTQIERRLSVTNLSSENNFVDVSTECSSRHHFHPDDDWSIQSKRRQSYFPNSSW